MLILAEYLFVAVVDDSTTEKGFTTCTAQAAEMITSGHITAYTADFRCFRGRRMTCIISATGRRRFSQIHLNVKLKLSLRR
jgi:hypothetical protein